MKMRHKKEPISLFLGDLLVLLVSLWLSLAIRYGSIPQSSLFSDHILPFSIIFFVSIIIFLISGLYEKHTVFFKNKLPQTILTAQIWNAIVAIALFYFSSYFVVAPKTTLIIYLIVSAILVTLWRLYGIRIFGAGKKENAIMIGSGVDAQELFKEINENDRYGIYFTEFISTESIDGNEASRIINITKSRNISIIVLDSDDKKVQTITPSFYKLMLDGVKFISINKLYEDVFEKIPVSLIGHSWFLENISTKTKPLFDFIKRVLDIFTSFILGILSLILYPFIYFAIKMDDGGDIFFTQTRVGKGNKVFKIYKFRSMNDAGITRVGKILRKTRIDELPQLWSVFSGKQSLIGPRPERPDYVELYNKEINFYNARHIVVPGLSGWAQVYQENHPHFTPGVSETMEKLSYDLYYVNNRSLWLDFKIILKTIKTLLSFKGK